uniref:Ig-like domain-containing protein n=1 Tax=Electrophorus electricus TaxID=8005 RepID=A0AAY5EP51_ELEEL
NLLIDPPKNVSISPSGEIVEGSSVTLTCSSDANPPVQNYTWFIEGGTSPVGSGQTYRIVNITAEHTGLYYCVAQNEHGALNGTVTISVKRGQSLSAVWSAVGGGAFFAVVVVVGVFICIYRNKKKRSETNHKETTQAAPSVSGAAADVQYATVTPSRSRPVQDDVQYATVRDLSDGVSSSDQQGEPLYATVTLQSYTAATGSPTQKMVEASVIYGTVKTD